MRRRAHVARMSTRILNRLASLGISLAVAGAVVNQTLYNGESNRFLLVYCYACGVLQSMAERGS